MAEEVMATQLRRMPLAASDDAGEAIIFAFEDTAGNRHTFAIHHLAIPEVVMKLTAATQQASMARGDAGLPGEIRQTRAIIPTKTEVGVSGDGTRVTISVYPVESTPLQFALSPSHSKELADSIQKAAAECAKNYKRSMQ